MANTATEDSTTVSGAPDTTVELAGDASAAGTVIAWDGQRILPQVRDRPPCWRTSVCDHDLEADSRSDARLAKAHAIEERRSWMARPSTL